MIISGRNEEKLKQCVEKLGYNAYYKVIDLNSVDDIDVKINQLFSEYSYIDILVNSAGVHSTKHMTDFFNTTEDEFDNILNTNLKGVYFISQKIANKMIEKILKGHILNISSSTASEPSRSAYRLSKLGLQGFTEGLAQTLTKYGIVVNCIAPGSTATGMLGYRNGDTIYTCDNEVRRFVMP